MITFNSHCIIMVTYQCAAVGCFGAHVDSFTYVPNMSWNGHPPYDWTVVRGLPYCPKHKVIIRTSEAVEMVL